MNDTMVAVADKIAAEPRAVRSSHRLQSLDILRGAVMVVMAIDHTRDWFHYGSFHFAPEDLSMTSVPIFLTRWITHFCAPVFIFFAGSSAYLSGRRKTPRDASRLLLTRGLWLIVVELTLINIAETGNLSYEFTILQVMWAIGWSMIALSFLMYVPWRLLLALSLAVIAGHNTLDHVTAEQFGRLSWLWDVLHVGQVPLQLSGAHTAIVIYPLIPWIFVMAAGYAFGRVFDLEPQKRRALLIRLGVALTAGFVIVRFTNIYGDPSHWAVQSRFAFTVLSFLNATKYPPSLLYLLMTLGPAIAVLGLLDGVTVGNAHPLLVFGRVPFFYYVLHWYVLHAIAFVVALGRYGHAEFLFGLPPSLPVSKGYPPDYGFRLAIVYLIWFAVVAITYPLCRWFAGVKSRNRSVVLSYL